MATKSRRHGEEEHEKETGERWLLTYADMITLLMVLFIVLFSIGQVDIKKFEQLREGLNGAFGTPQPELSAAAGAKGVLDGGVAPTGEGLADAKETAQSFAQFQQAQAQAVTEQHALQEAQKDIQGTLSGKGLGDQVTYHLESRGLILQIVSDQVLFDTGKADLRPDGISVLDGIADAIKALPNKIAVEGHTDDVPLNGGGPYATTWGLSAGRAPSVLRSFVEQRGIAAVRISAAGCAAQKPLVRNDNAFDRAKNRRVEIVVLASTA